MDIQTENPEISVLITSYNRANLICETIDSVLNQTFQSFEIIVSDNCSTDNTMEVLKKYHNNDKIRIYQNESNIGQFPNRNKAASYAKGKYLKYLDSDDLIYPWGLELLYKMMEQFPEAGWGLCSFTQVRERPFPFLLNPKQAYEFHYCNRVAIFNKAPLSSIIRKKIFESVGGFRDLNMAGDFEMWHRLALQSPVLLMPDGIVWNREHVGQEVRSYRRFLFQYEEVTKQFLESPQCPLEKNQIREVQKIKKKNLLRTIFLSGIKGNFSQVYDSSKMLALSLRNDYKKKLT
jgi:glycosyltransferase involved in cell wall biosynthesis